MDLLIKPSQIKGSISIPSSKSLTHRYFIAASLACGISQITNPLFCDDTNHTLFALKNLGVKIKKYKNYVEIKGTNGGFIPNNNKLDLGDSGTTARLLIGLSTLSKNPIIIDGSNRLRKRPNKELLEALIEQGVKIEFLEKNNHLPIKINPCRIKGGKIKISGKVSSQFISSLLFIAPFAKKDVEIEIIDDLKSRPYIDLTIQVMQNFGVKVENNNYRNFLIRNKQKYNSSDFIIEGDYSSASYFIALSYLLNKPIKLKNLNQNSSQGDKAILEKIKELNKKNAIIDVSNCPDIALTLGVIGPFISSLTLTGVNRLVAKECNRKQALIDNLVKLGAKLEVGHDFIKIYKSKLKSGQINTFGDHRVAMSFSIIGLMIPNGLIINNAEVVNKSYPKFFQDLKKIGANIKKI